MIQPAAGAPEPPVAQPIHRAGARRRVLVVDDSRLDRRILASHLAPLDVEMIEADSGEAALAICARTRIDIVLSDWMMPGLSGLDLCRALRAGPRDATAGEAPRADPAPDDPVPEDSAGDGAPPGGTEGEPGYIYFILLTSKGEKAEIAEGLRVGADDFVTKPVDRAELGARLLAGERILAMQEAQRETNRTLGEALAEVRALNAAIERDLEQARRLQHGLVRRWEEDFGAARATLLLRSSGHVGGDLVGFGRSARGVSLWGLDVSGHGITSALMSARLAGYLATDAPSAGATDAPSAGATDAPGAGATDAPGAGALPPSGLLARLNALSLEEMRTDIYFTMLHADLDLASGRVLFAQAGHPPPLVLRACGAAEFAGAGGLPVGMFEGAAWEDGALDLAPGDRLLIYSDGVTECEGASGAMLEEAGLAAMARACLGLTGRAFLEALMAGLAAHAGAAAFGDDVSMALLEYRGP